MLEKINIARRGSILAATPWRARQFDDGAGCDERGRRGNVEKIQRLRLLFVFREACFLT
jgi:hypothetical protein